MKQLVYFKKITIKMAVAGFKQGLTAKTRNYAASLLNYTLHLITCHYLPSADLVACGGWLKVCQGEAKAIGD